MSKYQKYIKFMTLWHHLSDYLLN